MYTTTEYWKNIEGCHGLYEISSHGRVKRIFKNGKVIILKDRINTSGYNRAALSRNGVLTDSRINRLVAMAFIPNPHNKPQVNHKNGIKNDDRVENLEWVTCSENIKHSYDTGLRTAPNAGKFGKNNHSSKPVIQTSMDGVVINEYESLTMASRITNVCRQSISRACLMRRLKSAGGFKWKFKN